MPSRYSATPVRTRTITGTTSVGGTTSTVVSIMPNSTIRFVDRAGNTVDVPFAMPALNSGMIGQAKSGAHRDDRATALFALVDALIARA